LQRFKVILLVFVTLLTGCSVARKLPEGEIKRTGIVSDSDMMEAVRGNNLTNNDFFIRKADIEIAEGKDIYKIAGTLRYKRPDSMLISLRTRMGLEAARIYFTGDTILINDRINRKLVCGDPVEIEKKYGVSLDLLAVVFGDLVVEDMNQESTVACTNGIYRRETFYKARRLEYNIDCDRFKTTSVLFEGEQQADNIYIRFRNFKRAGTVLIPTRIDVDSPGHDARITISFNVGKIELNWQGRIEFIPGNRYDVIKIR